MVLKAHSRGIAQTLHALGDQGVDVTLAVVAVLVGAAGAALVETILRDEKKLFTCCVSLNGEYGQKDICLGVPVIIGKNGWEKIIPFQLNSEEQALFAKSAEAVRSMNDVLSTLKA